MESKKGLARPGLEPGSLEVPHAAIEETWQHAAEMD